MIEREPVQRLIKKEILWPINTKVFGCVWIIQEIKEFWKKF